MREHSSMLQEIMSFLLRMDLSFLSHIDQGNISLFYASSDSSKEKVYLFKFIPNRFSLTNVLRVRKGCVPSLHMHRTSDRHIFRCARLSF